MSASFDKALARTLDFEGGYVHHPYDQGGATNRGITQRTYDNFRRTTGQVGRTVELIDDEEVRAIYLADYWMPCNCDSLPEHVAAAVFDMAVNSGVWNAKIALQTAAQVRADGVIGPQTIEAVNRTPQVLLEFLKQRGHLISEIVQEKPQQAVFLHGWINRLLSQAYELRP